MDSRDRIVSGTATWGYCRERSENRHNNAAHTMDSLPLYRFARLKPGKSGCENTLKLMAASALMDILMLTAVAKLDTKVFAPNAPPRRGYRSRDEWQVLLEGGRL